jgi:hypothetical protein
MDASAAASSTTARIMTLSPCLEHRENIVHDMFLRQAMVVGHFQIRRT